MVATIFEKKNILENVNRVGAYLEQQLLALKEKYSFIIDARGMGLIRGIEFTCPVGEIVSKCIANGLLVISAEANTIRFVPPLVITEENVDEMISILDGVLAQVQA